MEDIRNLIPRGKHDHERAGAVIEVGYPAVEPILPNLLEWIQDMNWPIAQTLAPFLASIGEPLIPHLEHIFETDDTIWKAWVISDVIEKSPPLASAFREFFEGIVDKTLVDEDDDWVRDNALHVLKKYGWR